MLFEFFLRSATCVITKNNPKSLKCSHTQKVLFMPIAAKLCPLTFRTVVVLVRERIIPLVERTSHPRGFAPYIKERGGGGGAHFIQLFLKDQRDDSLIHKNGKIAVRLICIPSLWCHS